TFHQDQVQAKITKWVTFDPPSEGQNSSDAENSSRILQPQQPLPAAAASLGRCSDRYDRR
ncbi:hypothetical protein ACFRCW_37230, partial [Streptomyces sp. NPDC056653]|uniref:hypothetical protein n=1 Tax=Streptomyces sp. NPDC056653 TaxID=3345894 RepID=UPI0036CF52CB